MSHHHIKSNCQIIDNIIKNMPDIAYLKEPYDPKKRTICRHNSICYEVECGFAHTYTIEARKKIRTAFLKEMKDNKIGSKPLSAYNTFFKEQIAILKEKEKEMNEEDRMSARAMMTHIAELWQAKKELKDNIKSDEYDESKKELKDNIHHSINKYYQIIAESKEEQKETKSKSLSNIFNSSLSTAKKHLFEMKEEKEEDSIIKINRWKDKIIELIYNFTISTIKCDTIEECNEIIDVINDIIYSFIIRPNTMTEIISEKTTSSKNIYNYRRYRIYIKYLTDYKTILNENDLLNSEYIKSSEELKQILETTKLFKNDYCINKFS
jgi:hypothetical protein